MNLEKQDLNLKGFVSTRIPFFRVEYIKLNAKKNSLDTFEPITPPSSIFFSFGDLRDERKEKPNINLKNEVLKPPKAT